MAQYANMTNVTLIALEFTAMCDVRQPTRLELEQLFVHVNTAGLDSLGVVDVVATPKSLSAPDCPISTTRSASASHTRTTIAVFFKIASNANVTNITQALSQLLNVTGDLQSATLSPVLFVVYFPSAALAISAIELAASGVLPGVLAASFFESDSGSSDHSDAPDSSSDSPVVIAVVVVVVVVLAVAVALLIVRRRRSHASEGRRSSAGEKGLSGVDGDMNTLFLPINLEDLEEWQPPSTKV